MQQSSVIAATEGTFDGRACFLLDELMDHRGVDLRGWLLTHLSPDAKCLPPVTLLYCGVE